MTWTEIALLILGLILLVLLVVLLFIVLRLRNKDGNGKETAQAAVLSDRMETLQKTVQDLRLATQLQEKELLDRMQAFEKETRMSLAAQQDALKGQIDLQSKAQENLLSTSLKDYQVSLLQTMNDTLANLNAKVDSSLKSGFDSTSSAMESLKQELGTLQEAQKNLSGLEEDVRALSKVLENNQSRGRYGEMQLEMVLESVFGRTKGVLYDLQTTIPASEGLLRPDAVVYLDGKDGQDRLYIDSKFPLAGYLTREEKDPAKKEAALSAFRQAFKAKIRETAKYVPFGSKIRYSVLFVPDDGLFASVEKNFPDLVEEARKSQVVLTCPAILPSLLASLRVLQIDIIKEHNLALLNQSLSRLSEDFQRFLPRWNKLSKNIYSLKENSEEMDRTVRKLDRSFQSISQAEESPERPLAAEEKEVLPEEEEDKTGERP